MVFFKVVPSCCGIWISALYAAVEVLRSNFSCRFFRTAVVTFWITSTVSKCDPFRWFLMVEEGKVTRSEFWWVRGLFQGDHRFFSPNIPWWNVLCVWGRAVVVQDSLNGEEFWPHTAKPLSQTFQILGIKLWLTVWPGGMNSRCTAALQWKIQISILMIFVFYIRASG
jgi:hypothetical protein